MRRLYLRASLTVVAFAAALTAPFAATAQSPRLEPVASFPHLVTGVAASEDGRLFVNFPRWTEDSPVSVAEVTRDGVLRPYPDASWNAWRNARMGELAPQDHWVCVQSVVADGRGSLWVVDAGAPAQDDVVPGAPKLVRVDLRTNRVAQVILFDDTVAPQGSYLNDVRFTPDGRHAILTDSGARGALVVVDLAAGVGRRVLDGHPSTQAEKDLVVMADGRPLRRPDGRTALFAADGLAITPDGAQLYWQALTSKTLYRINVAALTDPTMTAFGLEQRVQRAGENRVADAIWFDRSGRLILTAPEEDALRVRQGDGPVRTLVRDRRLRWPDSLAEGPDGTLYVTASHIQDSALFKPDAPPQLTTHLFRLPPGR